MTDLLIDDATGDLVIEDFNMLLTPDAVGSIKQRIQTRLRAFKGEYFLDVDFGTPYYQQVFVKGISKGVIDSIFRNIITETLGVINVTSFNSTLNSTNRAYTANWTALVNEDFPEEIEGTI